MNRRDFVKTGITTGSSAVAATTAGSVIAPSARAASSRRSAEHSFNLKYAPHFRMFNAHAGDDPVDQLKWAAKRGFTAWEDNGMKRRSVQEQERLAAAMEDLGIQMGVFVATATFEEVTFARKDEEVWERILDDIRESVEVAQRVNAKWMTVVPGLYDQQLSWDYQTANCIELLRRCVEILEPHDLVMVLEPLNHHTNHPGVFLSESPQAYMICEAVNSPSCKILFDIYHQQITEGNLIPNIDKTWDHIAYFQIGDNPGRNEPTTGEINYHNVFKHIYNKGYDGILGMEHGNSKPGKQGEEAVIQAYLECDDFSA